MNQYEYMRRLAEEEALPQSIRAVPSYREPIQAFARSEAERQLQDQQMAATAASRAMALERGEAQIGLGRGRLGLRQEEFERDLALTRKLRGISEREYRRALPFEIAGLGVEAFGSWQKFAAYKKWEDLQDTLRKRQETMWKSWEENQKALEKIIKAGQARYLTLQTPPELQTKLDFFSARPQAALPMPSGDFYNPLRAPALPY